MTNLVVAPDIQTSGLSAEPRRGKRSATHLWTRYILGRLGGLLGVVVALLAITFLLIQFVPGDPARNIVGVTATQEQVEVVRERLGLNDPFLLQAWNYVSGLLGGDLGNSFVTQQPIVELIGQRLPLTAAVAVGGLVVVLIVGFPVGIAVAFAERRGGSKVIAGAYNAAAGFLGAIPEYITGTILVMVFALTLQWLPAQGGQGFNGLILPAIAVGLAPAAVMSRIARNETRSVLGQEYIATARSKRISEGRLLFGHALPNIATSSLTMGGILLVALLGGTVIVENVFNIPGLGTQIVQSILSSDYPAIQGIILTLGLLAALVNLAVDILLGVLDPRVLTKSKAA
ncbi:ABC transporter permease [Microbacterium sp. CPCC 204701]|uniref:ABC transporter permease n=1 Tax=Microbacterium sp. CPCC 204701 TaxID=2493084 RepID=UPI000FDB42D3|nr:ABC transporter permease [Microbacterium sp. CPCC 204701]